jgi:hypothetical protein
MLTVFLLPRLWRRRQCRNSSSLLWRFFTAVHFLKRSIETTEVHEVLFIQHLLFLRRSPVHLPPHTLPGPLSRLMVVWHLVCAWRRSLVFLARGLCACSLAVLYLSIGFAGFSGYHTARAALPSHPRASLAEESTVSSSPPTAQEGLSAISETTHVGFDAPFDTHCHPRSFNGQPLVLNLQASFRPLVIPKIVVQDFSAEDGSISYKTPEYDLTHNLKRGRRPSWACVPTTLGDRLPVNRRPSTLGLPPPLGVPATGGLRSLYLVDGFNHRRSDVFVQNPLGFPGRKRVLGDVVAEDGSFVIVGL